MAIGATADGLEVCRVRLLVDGRKKTCRRCGKDAARKGEKGEKDGGFAGEHLESCWLLAKWLVRGVCVNIVAVQRGSCPDEKARQMGKVMSVGIKE